MIRPPDELKVVCERIASAWKLEGQASSLRSMEVLLNWSVAKPSRMLSWSKPNDIQQIGAWFATGIGDNKSFTRAGKVDAAKFWAETQTVPCSHEKKRVVLLGESLARGYYYEPEFTPALAIQEVLCRASDDVEVIDLSRIALGLWELLEMICSCVALSPDAVVIMAGNNWHPVLSGMWTAQNSRELAAVLRKDYTNVAVKKYLFDVMAAVTEIFLEETAKLPRLYGIPVLHVIPECNLSDWRIPEVIPPLLAHSQLEEWITQRERGREALNGGDPESGARSANRLLELDQGSHPSGFYLLADAKTSMGDGSKVESLFREARDCNIIARHHHLHCYSPIADVIRRYPASDGFHVLDLAVSFKKYLEGQTPGRRLFLDYCHLSDEGIALVATESAKQLLPMLGKGNYDDKYARPRPHASAEVIAKAHMLASIMNSKMGQQESIIEHHVTHALKATSKAIPVVRSLLELKLRKVPLVLYPQVFDTFADLEQKHRAGCRSERLESTSATRILQYSPEHFVDSLELPYIRALTNIIERLDASTIVDGPGRLCEHYAVTEKGRDLLESVYIDSPIAEERRWMDLGGSGFLRAFGSKSAFIILATDADDLEVIISCRCRDANSSRRDGKVLLNGEEITSIVVENRWRMSSFIIGHEKLRRGVNQLAIKWPVPDSTQIACHCARQIDALELGRAVQPSLVFGEIHELRIRACARE